MPKKILHGVVVNDKENKTIKVMIERKYQHPLFKKVVKSKKKYSAHDEDNKFKVGDATMYAASGAGGGAMLGTAWLKRKIKTKIAPKGKRRPKCLQWEIEDLNASKGEMKTKMPPKGK